MKILNLRPKPLSKAERAYNKQVEANRSKQEFIQFKNLDSLVKQKMAEQKEEKDLIGEMNYFTPEYIKDWIKNS